MNKALCLAATLASAIVAGPALAWDLDEGWRVSVTPYLWVSAYDNKVTDKSNRQTSDSSASFGDILGNLTGVPLIGKGEIQYGRVGVYGDLIYLRLSDDRTTTRPVLGSIKTKADLDTTTVTAAAFYRVVQSDSLNIDLLGGLRYVKLKLGLDVQGAGPGLEREASKPFTEAIVGARATRRIGSKSSLTGYGDYGGFGGSRDVWQVNGTYNYQWTPKLTVSAGYRYMRIEIDKARLNSKVTLSGPLLGMTYRF